MSENFSDSPNAEPLALVFDWGNTLMKADPDLPGPMAFWPQVTEVDGVVEALEKLVGQARLVVGTNAGQSNAPLVWKALRRVGLGEYFNAVFTAQELGYTKPSMGFFRQIENVLAKPPHRLVMIGDSYSADISGAKAAGWKTIWYNPACQLAPGAWPLHDAEIANMRELPQAIRRLALPDPTTCFAWLGQRGAPYNLLAHIQLVASGAYTLAAWLRKAGQPVDPVLAHRGGMLHDLAKMESLRQREQPGAPHVDHAKLACELLMDLGQPELAEIANRHMPYSAPDDARQPRTWEEKLVHYADKLAEGARLVSLNERIARLKDRYPSYSAELEASLPRLLEMQAEICAALNLSADDLLKQLRETLGLSFP